MSTVVTHKKRSAKTERRRALRHIALIRYPVTVQIKTDTGDGSAETIGVGIVTDISKIGLGVILDRPLRGGIEVLLILNPSTEKESQLEARAIWTSVLPSTGHIIKPDSTTAEFWRVGLKFETDDAEQSELIDALIKQLDR